MESDLARLIAEALRVPEAVVRTPETQLDALPSWDSMSRVELIVSLEDHYGVELSQDEIVSLRSIDDIRKVLESKGRV